MTFANEKPLASLTDKFLFRPFPGFESAYHGRDQSKVRGFLFFFFWLHSLAFAVYTYHSQELMGLISSQETQLCCLLGLLWLYVDFPVAQTVKSLPAMQEPGSIPGLGSSSGEGFGNPLQYSCLENSMDREAWWATVRGVTNSWTRLSD